jgi:D-arabinose 1-dehydrogenase-like Zn-dependent alcohol dehydrogenase
MHAAVVVEFGKPLAFRGYDIPTPGPGQIPFLVRIDPR